MSRKPSNRYPTGWYVLYRAGEYIARENAVHFDTRTQAERWANSYCPATEHRIVYHAGGVQ